MRLFPALPAMTWQDAACVPLWTGLFGRSSAICPLTSDVTAEQRTAAASHSVVSDVTITAWPSHCRRTRVAM